jgi:hypothetical protein
MSRVRAVEQQLSDCCCCCFVNLSQALLRQLLAATAAHLCISHIVVALTTQEQVLNHVVKLRGLLSNLLHLQVKHAATNYNHLIRLSQAITTKLSSLTHHEHRAFPPGDSS